MRSEHRAPLVASIIVLLVCVGVVAHAVRTEALGGFVRHSPMGMIAATVLNEKPKPEPVVADAPTKKQPARPASRTAPAAAPSATPRPAPKPKPKPVAKPKPKPVAKPKPKPVRSAPLPVAPTAEPDRSGRGHARHDSDRPARGPRFGVGGRGDRGHGHDHDHDDNGHDNGRSDPRGHRGWR
jgi:outer membrane biosynthesis protein TonB